MSKLYNPEDAWVSSSLVSVISRAEVEKCVGSTSENLELLSGGQANSNIRIGNDRVLRLYRRDVAVAGKELSLLKKAWKSFVVPELIQSGNGFLVTKYMNHLFLEDTAEMGSALGQALAEIHSNNYTTSGFLGSDLKIEESMDDFVDDMWSYLCSFMDVPQKPALPTVLLDEVVAFFDSKIDGLKQAVGPSVLLHGDFKVSNLRWSDQDKPLVLDWEFAYAGSALMDLGQLFRWPTSQPFEEAFVAAYRAAGRELPDRWKYEAGILDLINLAGLLYKSAPDSQKAIDIAGKIKSTIQAG
ncbi:MAG TPA: aminoglycoside phosphotransferase family protein [bacterium]|jgi:aminoglycoside phosphotransferase (APT) family kinase protein|nr:aminoglycoside phosphotransferase family protein [bacterium]